MVRYPSYSAQVNSNASINDQVPSLVSSKATASTLSSVESNDNGEDSLKDKADTMPTPSSSSSSSSSSATTSSSSSEIIASPIYNNSTYICIITDLTDASNTCKRHAINLSSNLLIDSLIKEAANFFSYDPYSFNLMWKFNDELMNLSEIQTSSLTLADLNLNPKSKNLFEIHETQNGPPKRLKIDDFGYEYDTNNESSPSLRKNGQVDDLVGESPRNSSRRNATFLPQPVSFTIDANPNNNEIEYGPCVNPFKSDSNPSSLYLYSSVNLASGSSSFFNYDDDTGYVGLINQAMTCYLNSLLQTLFMTPEFRNGIYRWKYNDAINDDEEGKKNIPFQLQRLFLNLQTSTKKSIQTSDLTKSFGWNSDDAFQQHDVQELCRVMFDALEKTFKNTQQENLINELYQGKIKDYVKCLECHKESARCSVFLDISLCIKPFGSDKTFESVEAALDAFVQPEILDENNKYFCDKCNKMCKAHKGLKFESFPYIVSLQLNRFDFDYSTMSRFKLSNTVTFPEILNVKKYLEKENEDANSKPSETINEPFDKIIPVSDQSDFSENLSAKSERDESYDSRFDYELFSIMIHSGSATGGHYYAYIKCFETNQWYNFNDERVSKLDRQDIKKAFGTTNSIYSSTTAYMLLYRQVNQQRNEKFIKVEEFDEHLKSLLEKEKAQQLEADRLKEYIENSCKVKVMVPDIADLEDKIVSNSDASERSRNSDLNANLNTTLTSENSEAKLNGSNSSETGKKREKTINIHKDLTLDLAKFEIMKEFELTDYINRNNKKCRILKYDTYNDLIEQSYLNESSTTVFEALGFTKYPYNHCWYLEILPASEEFIDYSTTDLNVKLVNINMTTFETNDLFSLRLKSDATVAQLINETAKRLNCNENSIRMALEKPHTLYNYVYLNKNLNDTLKSQHFCRVNKVFVEYQDEMDLNKKFESSKFCYALDAIMNMLHMVVYLPSEEESETFVRKQKRHILFIENQRKQFKSSDENECDQSTIANNNPVKNLITEDNTVDSYDAIPSVQSSSNTVSSLIADTEVNYSVDNQFSPISTTKTISSMINNQEDSKMSVQSADTQPKTEMRLNEMLKEDLELIEDHFKVNDGNPSQFKKNKKSQANANIAEWFDHNANEMETSLDEGIGSSGSLSNNHAKNSPNSIDYPKTSPVGFDYRLFENQKQSELNDESDFSYKTPKNDPEDIDNDIETNIGDVEDRQLDDIANLLDNVDDDDLNIDFQKDADLDDEKEPDSASYSNKNIFNEFKHKNRVSFLSTNQNDNSLDTMNDSSEHNPDLYWTNQDKPNQNEDLNERIKLIDYSTRDNTFSYSPKRPINHDDPIVDSYVDDLPDYSELEKLKSFEKIEAKANDDDDETLADAASKLNERRFIKSNLLTSELGTRTLEIRMDKRMDLNTFKSHVNEYLKLGNDNFRVFRNDFECELTAYENQFSYLTQNTKFVIKLGPPLKYGEYVIPVYKLNKAKGTFAYLCDFMIVHGLSVLNHKELLKDDLKDECNLEIDFEKTRLRKKVGKRPGSVFLSNEVFGVDIFVNLTTELCIETLDEQEKKKQKGQSLVYLRHWKPDEYVLTDLEEVVIDGNSYDLLVNFISNLSGIPVDDIEVLKCKRDYPYKSPILELHKDLAWKEKNFLALEKLEDGACYYYRNKTLKLGVISEEKRREMVKEDNLNFRPTFVTSSKKETGIKIHVDS